MFEILTRNCEGTNNNKLPKSKFAMLYHQNCDMWSVFNKHQKFEFFQKTKNYALIFGLEIGLRPKNLLELGLPAHKLAT